MEKIEKNLYLMALCIGAVCLGFAVLFHISGKVSLPFSYPCIFHAFTGYYCPGCGGTRAVEALFTGHVLKSFYYHPIVPYVAILYLWFAGGYTIELFTKKRLRFRFPWKPLWLWIMLAIVILNCIIKNAVLYFTGVALL